MNRTNSKFISTLGCIKIAVYCGIRESGCLPNNQDETKEFKKYRPFGGATHSGNQTRNLVTLMSEENIWEDFD